MSVMTSRCPYCGSIKNYEYYLVRFVIYASTTWFAYEFLDSKFHLTEKVSRLFSALF
jgi:hypothetical protein